MRIFARLSVLLAYSSSPAAELSTEEVFEELLARHQKTESYFAVYEGKAPQGKTVSAAISYHGPGQMASVHTQFLANGKVVAAPLQAITSELGIVISGQNSLQLKDAPLILDRLSNVADVLFSGQERSLGTWSPALSMTKETMAAQLTISSSPQMPWVRDGLPVGTRHIVEGEFIIFTTPEGCVSKVQSATGILQHQNFPNAEGDRTLVLKDLQTNLSAEEISAFIGGYVPADLEEQSLRTHPLLPHIQHQMFRELVASADDGKLSSYRVNGLLAKAKPLLYDYFEALYPPDFWPNPNKQADLFESQIEELRAKTSSQWERIGLKPEGLQAKTINGEMTAEILVSTLKGEFLRFLENKTTLPKEENEPEN